MISSIHAHSGGFAFDWNPSLDHATLRHHEAEVWNGPLLPLFWLQATQGPRAVAAVAMADHHDIDNVRIDLQVGDLGAGVLHVKIGANGIRFTRLTCQWAATPPPALIALYFGSKPLTSAQRAAAPGLDLPFWPGWRAEGYGIAGAKTSPMQSFFRSWDLGHADIARGSIEQDAAVRNWGRLETINGQPTLTALTLRESSPAVCAEPMLNGVSWSGRWAVIAQADHAIWAPGETAIIAYDAGFLAVALAQAPDRVVVFADDTQTAYRDWTWNDGELRLTVDDRLVKRALMGFVVTITGQHGCIQS